MAGVRQPSDKSHFLLPDLGEGLAEAELIDWKVKAGDTVKKGQTLLIVEAMKTMNPIQAPRDGVVAEILVGDAQPVEFGEPLVLLEA